MFDSTARAFARFDRALTGGPSDRELAEHLAEDQAHERLCAVEDAGCDLAPVGPRRWVVSYEGATLGEGADVDAAVLSAWPAAVRLGLVTGEVQA